MTSTVPAKATGAAHLLGGPPPLRLRAWDGSESGPADAPVAVLRPPGVDQVVGVRPGTGGRSGRPETTHAWYEGLVRL